LGSATLSGKSVKCPKLNSIAICKQFPVGGIPGRNMNKAVMEEFRIFCGRILARKIGFGANVAIDAIRLLSFDI
jgi:hypothetical protein